MLRTSFDIDRVPDTAPCRVTADGRYQLWVNGVLVGRGPGRGEPSQLRYDTYDLAPLLATGENVVGVFVRSFGMPIPYWKPAPQTGSLGFGGLLLEAHVGDRVIATDSTWRGCVAPYERPAPGAWSSVVAPDIVDGREMPSGWATPGFDDRAWTPARELAPAGLGVFRAEPPSDPFGDLSPSELPPLAERLVQPTEIVAEGVREDGAPWTTYDLGRILNGHVRLTVDADAGTVFELSGGEELHDTGRPVVEPRRWRMRYTTAGTSGETIEALESVGLRYVEVAVSQGSARAVDLAASDRYFPRPEGASFECDDAFLNELWMCGARGLDACSTDAFLDCPGREQRAWLGDAYVHTMLSLVTNPDSRLARWNAVLHGQGARADGLLPMVAGGDFTDIITIPDYSLHWVRTVARLWDHLGDADLVEALLPRATNALRWFEKHRNPEGALEELTGWIFIDWAQTERRANIGAVDALYALALDDHAVLAAAIGDDGTAARSRARADESRAAMDRYWDGDRGVYVDATDADGTRGRRVSQHTNTLAVLCGAAPPSRWDAMFAAVTDDARLVMTRHPGDGGPEKKRLWYHWAPPEQYGGAGPFDEERDVVLAQPFFQHLVHQAYVKADRHDLLMASMERWRPLVARGNGVLEEYWDHVPGHGSRCHAWSGTPTYDLTAHVLGVRSSSPGYTTVHIEPHLGSLQFARGSVPTPHGWINASFAADGTGSVVLPTGVTGTLRFDGRDVALSAGRVAV